MKPGKAHAVSRLDQFGGTGEQMRQRDREDEGQQDGDVFEHCTI
jgi:hypothetical protein